MTVKQNASASGGRLNPDLTVGHSDPPPLTESIRAVVNSRYRLPAGLPACVADAKSGLKVLEDLFGLPNRRQWQSILASEAVKDCLDGQNLKLKNLATSKKVARRVLAFYGDPDARSDGWALYCELGLDLSAVFDPDLVPSLEFAALKRYEPEFHDWEFDFDLAERALSDVTGFRHSRQFALFVEPALVVWPSLREDLLRWDELTASEQDTAVLATFAVASVIDDLRILEWASARSARLAKEFAFAVRDAPGASPGQADSGRLDTSDRLPASNSLLAEWNRSCDLITEIASDLRSSAPQLQRVDDLINPVKRLEALRSEMAAAIDLRKRQALARRVVEILAACSKEFNAPWLDGIQSQVCALWQIAWCLERDAPEDELTRDLERLRSLLTEELRQWREFERAKQDQRAELLDLQLSADSDLESQLEAESREQSLQERMLGSARQATSCKRRILTVIAPDGRDLDTAKDYEAELEAALAVSAAVGAAAPSDSSRAAPDDRFSGGSDPAGPASQDGGRQADGEAPSRGDAAKTTESEATRRGSAKWAGVKRRTAKKAVSSTDVTPAAARREAVECVPFWDGAWDEWLERIGDPGSADSVRPWNSADVPACPGTDPFGDPASFAQSLGWKLKSAVIESPRHTLLALVEFLASDPQKGRREWIDIYREILNYCARGQLDAKDSQAIAFALISLSLKTSPDPTEYRHMVDSVDRLTAQTSDFEDVKWALELSDLFLWSRCPDRDYLAVYLENIHEYVSMSGYHLSSKHQRMQSKIQKFLGSANDDAARASLAAGSVEDLQRLSSFLRGKRVVIYTLQLSAARIARDRIRAIESSAEFRLLDNKVWSESLQDPIRNADLCVMVKSAATHAVTEMISRTRRNAGKDVIVPSWKGVHSLIRAIEKAAGLGEASALAAGMHGAGGVA